MGLKKGIITSMIIAFCLFFSSISVNAEPKDATSKNEGTVELTAAKKTVSKKGVMTFPQKYNIKKVAEELKPEAAKLIKIYGDSLGTGKTKAFNSYVNKHVSDKIPKEYLLGRKYVKDNYSEKVKGMRKANSKKTITAYAKEVKKVKTSKVKVGDTRKGTGYGTGYAKFQYQFEPENFNAFGTVTIYFNFTLLKSGKYILEDVYIGY